MPPDRRGRPRHPGAFWQSRDQEHILLKVILGGLPKDVVSTLPHGELARIVGEGKLTVASLRGEITQLREQGRQLIQDHEVRKQAGDENRGERSDPSPASDTRAAESGDRLPGDDEIVDNNGSARSAASHSRDHAPSPHQQSPASSSQSSRPLNQEVSHSEGEDTGSESQPRPSSSQQQHSTLPIRGSQHIRESDAIGNESDENNNDYTTQDIQTPIGKGEEDRSLRNAKFSNGLDPSSSAKRRLVDESLASSQSSSVKRRKFLPRLDATSYTHVNPKEDSPWSPDLAGRTKDKPIMVGDDDDDADDEDDGPLSDTPIPSIENDLPQDELNLLQSDPGRPEQLGGQKDAAGLAQEIHQRLAPEPLEVNSIRARQIIERGSKKQSTKLGPRPALQPIPLNLTHPSQLSTQTSKNQSSRKQYPTKKKHVRPRMPSGRIHVVPNSFNSRFGEGHFHHEISVTRSEMGRMDDALGTAVEARLAGR